MLNLRKYEDRDFVDYVSTLEKTTAWKRKAGTELKARLDKMKKGEQAWVAEIDARGVGFMIVAPNDDNSLEIDWLDVHPSFQRMGIGTALVEKAEKTARARGMLALSIRTRENNEKALSFVFKNGFEKFERIKGFYGKRKDAIRLKKIIPYDL